MSHVPDKIWQRSQEIVFSDATQDSNYGRVAERWFWKSHNIACSVVLKHRALSSKKEHLTPRDVPKMQAQYCHNPQMGAIVHEVRRNTLKTSLARWDKLPG